MEHKCVFLLREREPTDPDLGTGIETAFAYDAGGALTNVSYSATNTPGISYTLDRLGRSVQSRTESGRGKTPTGTMALSCQRRCPSCPATRWFTQGWAWQLTTLLWWLRQVVHRTVYVSTTRRISTVSDGTREASYAYGPDPSTWTNLSFDALLSAVHSMA